MIDEAGVPAGAAVETAPTDEVGVTPAAGSPRPSAPAVVPLDINERYAQQTNARRWARQFEREGREVFDHRDEIIRALAVRPGQHVADVGAGSGLFTLALAAAVGAEGRVYAVDVQAYFLDHIGQRARAQNLSNVELVRARHDAVGLAEASVELVLMCDSYHHVERPAAYLASLHRALRPAGRLVVVDYRAVEGQSDAWVLEHVRASPDQFRAEIESAGFRFVRAHEEILKENFFYEFERIESR